MRTELSKAFLHLLAESDAILCPSQPWFHPLTPLSVSMSSFLLNYKPAILNTSIPHPQLCLIGKI